MGDALDGLLAGFPARPSRQPSAGRANNYAYQAGRPPQHMNGGGCGGGRDGGVAGIMGFGGLGGIGLAGGGFYGGGGVGGGGGGGGGLGVNASNGNVPNGIHRQRHPSFQLGGGGGGLMGGQQQQAPHQCGRAPSGGLRRQPPPYALQKDYAAVGAAGGYAGLSVAGCAPTANHAAPAVAAVAAAAPPPLTHGFADEQNVRFRKHMEDEHTAVPNFADRRGSLYCGLYDGHGGRHAVEFVKNHLHATIERELRSGSPGEAPLEAIRRGFRNIDRMLLQIGTMHCGTTCAVCLCLSGQGASGSSTDLHVANVGDTRVVLVCEGGQPAKRLSVDHVATDPEEVRRVQRDGGHVVNNRVGGSLAITRALGDHALKSDDGGVSCEPHTVVHRVGPSDRFVVMASDGIWDVMSDDDVQDLVLSNAELPNDDLAQSVIQSALARGTRDNLSVLVVRLR